MLKKVLVLGGTGLLGRSAVLALQKSGYQVRIMTHNKGNAQKLFDSSFELIQGDVTDEVLLEKAIYGCQGIHISIGGSIDQLSAENVSKLAPKFEIERITYISGATVREENRWFPMTAQKLNAENAIRNSRVNYTIFCPTWPMEMLVRFARAGKPFLIGKQPNLIHWFALDDLGRMITAAYQKDEAINKRFFIHGPQAITLKHALELYCKALHPNGKPVSVIPVWVAKLLGLLTRNQTLKFAADLMNYFDKTSEGGDPADANKILGAPKTTLEDWIKQQQK